MSLACRLMNEPSTETQYLSHQQSTTSSCKLVPSLNQFHIPDSKRIGRQFHSVTLSNRQLTVFRSLGWLLRHPRRIMIGILWWNASFARSPGHVFFESFCHTFETRVKALSSSTKQHSWQFVSSGNVANYRGFCFFRQIWRKKYATCRVTIFATML